MKIAVTGASGLFGQAVARVFAGRHTVIPFNHSELDITHPDLVHAAFASARPDVVVHTAAIPDLDVCEDNPAKAFLVNTEGTRHVAEAARWTHARVALISTDAVFDGLSHMPYLESDPTNPPTVYGRSKLMAERIVRYLPEYWIFRVSVLFGPGKTNFVEKCLRAIAAGKEFVAAEDQMGSATYTMDGAEKIMEVIEAGRYGLYHLSNEGACSRLELAREAARIAKLDPAKVAGKPMSEMSRRAKRLKYAVMETAALRKAGFAPLRPWKNALADYIATIDPPLPQV
jgi:dTDP-4-dehydrorhamnose reductase